jgi:succinyl-diaminopimelate desuccinylase
MLKMTYSIIELTQQLIKIPTQGGIDLVNPALELIRQWLLHKGVNSQLIYSADEKAVGVSVNIGNTQSNNLICLYACLDTAPFGDPDSWHHSPTSGIIEDGWLYGRGSADSKIAVSILCHLAVEFNQIFQEKKQGISFFFDGDEHTGQFNGIKTYTKEYPEIKKMWIAYPGNDQLNIGARGFYRAEITVYGIAAHSGSSASTQNNAIVKSSLLINSLNLIKLNEFSDEHFELSPKISVTEIAGGKGYSIIPDRCTIKVDIRLTPTFGHLEARRMLSQSLAMIDNQMPSGQKSILKVQDTWPAYKLDINSDVVDTLLKSANEHFNKKVNCRVCGPSNVGNYLSSLDIEATCGFGVTCKNIHASNECVDISTIKPVYDSYFGAVMELTNAS